MSAAKCTAPVGILGGTFDPVHHGHLRMALELREQLGLARVHLVPTGVPVHRSPPVASAEQRQGMLECAIAGMDELVVDDRELRRSGPSFMVETLADFRRDAPAQPLCLLLGMDAFSALNTWYRWQDVLELAHLGIARRPGAGLPHDTVMGDILAANLLSDPRGLCNALAGRIAVGEVSKLDISSTHIRALLAARRSPRFLLPDNVLNFITREELYADAK